MRDGRQMADELDAMLSEKDTRIAELEAASRRLVKSMHEAIDKGETFPAAVAFAANNLENVLSK